MGALSTPRPWCPHDWPVADWATAFGDATVAHPADVAEADQRGALTGPVTNGASRGQSLFGGGLSLGTAGLGIPAEGVEEVLKIMRSPRVILSLAAIVVAVAACGSDDPEQTGPTPTGASTVGPTGTGTGTGVTECVVGDWRTTGTEGELGGDPATVTVSGGSGVLLAVGADGATTVDFTEMQPVSFDGEVAGADVAGELSYAGEASGTIQTDTGTTSGTWEPVETADWSGVTVTVDLTEPVVGTPIDDAPIGDVLDQADEVTGEIIDVEPMLGEGRFECDGDTLILSPSEGEGGMSWTLTRA